MLIVVICFKFSNFAYANTVPIKICYESLQVVICFKFSNFAYANTVDENKTLIESLLLFALNLVTLLMQIQSELIDASGKFNVVICFKFSNFAYANTVMLPCFIPSYQLLFALNLVTLLMQIQF